MLGLTETLHYTNIRTYILRSYANKESTTDSQNPPYSRKRDKSEFYPGEIDIEASAAKKIVLELSKMNAP